MNQCQACGSQTNNSSYCQQCTTRFKNDLHSLPVGLPELRLIAARKASVMAKQHSGSNRSVAPIPLNMNAFQLLEDITVFAQQLGRALHLKYGHHMPVESLLKAVEQRAQILLDREDASSIIRLARMYARKLHLQLTPPEDRRMIGTCPHCHRDQWCTDAEITGGWIGCSCGMTLKIQDIQEQHLLTCALADNENAQGTAAAISKLLHANGIDIKRKTINEWRRREIILPITYKNDHPVYRVWDVWKASIRGSATLR